MRWRCVGDALAVRWRCVGDALAVSWRCIGGALEMEMVRIVLAEEDDVSRVMEIELEAFSPPWTVSSLLSESHREDSFFAVAVRPDSSDICIQSAEFRNPGVREERDAMPVLCPSLCSSAHIASPFGFVILRGLVDDGELLQIAVDKRARRCGVADLLMDAAIGYALEKELKAIFLEVRKSNDAAIALYKKHGFKSVRLRSDYYSNPLEDAVVMVRALTPVQHK